MTVKELEARVKKLEDELGEARSVIRHTARFLQQLEDIPLEPLRKRMDKVLAV